MAAAWLPALAAVDAGLSVVVLEKGKKFGGTTGISGGGIWVPNNPTLRRAGHDDSRESVRPTSTSLTEGGCPAPASRPTSTRARPRWSCSSAARG